MSQGAREEDPLTQTGRDRPSGPESGPGKPARLARPGVASLLSFVWPGLGQAYRGDRRLGMAYALPPALVVLAAAGIMAVLGPLVVVAYLFNPVVSLGLIGLVVALALWRSASILQAAGLRRDRPPVIALAAVLIGLVVLTHGWMVYGLWSFYTAGQEIYEPIGGAPSPTPPADPAPGTSDDPGQTPPASPPGSDGTPEPLPGQFDRVTILLVGMDNTHSRDFALTDTLMVASFDPISQSLTMISIPRDISRLPFYAGGEWRPRINTLMQHAARNPELYPDGPMGTLVKEISHVVGVPIDYYAQIDIAGFTRLIDMVGGVDVVVERAVNDPGYQFSPDEVGFRVEPGPHHFDGKMATAYSRSRRGSSDYDRARRQQQVLLALRRKLDDPFVLSNVSGLVDAVADMIRTDAPLERFPDIVSIAQRTQDASTNNVVLSPPKYARSVFSESGVRTFQLELRMEAVADLSIELFGQDSLYAHESD